MDRRENRSLSGRRRRYLWLLGAVVAAWLPVACGKKGPLYLPDDAATRNQPGEPVTRPAPPLPER
jgi:predicted small lipoprotein YifL